MNLPIEAAAYGLVILCGSIFTQFRKYCLLQMASKVRINEGSEYNLRTAIWAYLGPIFTLGMGGAFFMEGVHARGFSWLIVWALSLLFFCGSIYVLRSFFTARLLVTKAKLIYFADGKCEEIPAEDVLRVTVKLTSFRVGLRWDKHIQLPSTLKSSEIALAFLLHAIAENNKTN